MTKPIDYNAMFKAQLDFINSGNNKPAKPKQAVQVRYKRKRGSKSSD
jgi:hypothetical protein